jgi:hypothetical protein
VDFHRYVFNILFMGKDARPYTPDISHPAPSPIPGWYRMYGLYKNVLLLSLLRRKKAIAPDDGAGRRLFDAVCAASRLEAQRIIMHIFGFHCREVERHRALLLEAMEYCAGGGIRAVTQAGQGAHRLDGLLMTHFAHADSALRKSSLESLYEDKELMLVASLAFLVIFMTFREDENFFLEGVSESGITPIPPRPPQVRV